MDPTRVLMVDLNRHVRVRGPMAREGTAQSIDELSCRPFVVILGEPGIGKSSILSREAARHGADVLTMRQLIEGERPDTTRRVFVDALDEYRSSGDRADKSTDVMRIMRGLGTSEIWVACRTEDWRPKVDDIGIPRAVSTRDAVVVEVSPLRWAESVALLSAWGEPDATAFMVRSWSLGVSSFTENPLSLRLLREAVAAKGRWPETRFDVFDQGVRNLSREHADRGDARLRPSEVKIRSTAARTCLLMLLSGRRAVWKPGRPPDDASEYLTHADLDLDPRELSWCLDTPLFRGEGASFQPMHRSVAEFLAAEALAEVVRPGPGRAALPLSRALALLSGGDVVAPTELRGLYAWFAAHVAQRGGYDEAARLAETDAPTVLSYGDPAVLGTKARRTLLANLTKRDPYVLTGDLGPTSIAGLPGEDILPELGEILRAGPNTSHLVQVVLSAVSQGKPLVDLQPLLRELTLDPTRPGWLRGRALDALLHSVTNPGRACLDLLAELEEESPSEDRTEIRTSLTARLDFADLTPDVVLLLLRERVGATGGASHGSLYPLQQRLFERPMPGLFAQALKDPRSEPDPLFQDHEAMNLLDHALATCIDNCGDDGGPDIWRWARNVGEHGWEALPEHSQIACRRWMAVTSAREIGLFLAILDDPSVASGPLAVNSYIAKTGSNPSPELVRALIVRVQTSREPDPRLASAVASAVFLCPHGSDLWERLFDVLNPVPEHAEALEALTRCHRPFSPDMERFREARVQHLAKKAEAVRQAIVDLRPHLAALRQGKGVMRALYDAAVELHAKPRTTDGFVASERVRLFADAPTRDAIVDGWVHLATKGLGRGVDAGSMGRSAAGNRTFYVEAAALAGIDLLMDRGTLPPVAEVPVEVALAICNNLHVVSDADRRERLERWARDRLDVDPEEGGALLGTFWEAMADANALDLRPAPLHTTAAGRVATIRLLQRRPDLSHPCLMAALGFATGFMDRASLSVLAASVLRRDDLGARPKSVWDLISVATDARPLGSSDLSPAALTGAGWVDLREMTHLLSTLAAVEGADPGRMAALTFALTAGRAGPDAIGAGGGIMDDCQEQSLIAIQALNLMASRTDAVTWTALNTFAHDDAFRAWHPNVRHALAVHERGRRDAAFVHPTPERVREALRGEGPANSADLRALVVEELRRLADDVRHGDLTLWISFWNTEGEKATSPRVENLCRNEILGLLRPRLDRFGVQGLPEARRAEGTRADILVMTRADDNVPVEIKRQQHSELWTAAAAQLREYGRSPGAAAAGIYLVLWFGADQALPGRPDGRPKPTAASDLETMLRDDLPEDLVGTVDVVVLDVSRPGPPAKRRGSKATTAGRTKRQPV